MYRLAEKKNNWAAFTRVLSSQGFSADTRCALSHSLHCSEIMPTMLQKIKPSKKKKKKSKPFIYQNGSEKHLIHNLQHKGQRRSLGAVWLYAYQRNSQMLLLGKQQGFFHPAVLKSEAGAPHNCLKIFIFGSIYH